MDDAEAIDRLMNPAKNPYRVDMLDVAYHSPMMRALNHTSYVFEKKLSHTADSQDQRAPHGAGVAADDDALPTPSLPTT
ncbi:MAG: hypothetical protein WKG07_46430 [Hymenobacter sp.]